MQQPINSEMNKLCINSPRPNIEIVRTKMQWLLDKEEGKKGKENPKWVIPVLRRQTTYMLVDGLVVYNGDPDGNRLCKEAEPY